MRKSIAVFCALFMLGTACASEAELAFEDVTSGDTHRLSDYRGKWVVVNYWATWCPPCLEELPELVHFHESHKDQDAVVLGINMEELETGRLSQFLGDNLITYPVGVQLSDEQLLGPVPGLPTTYLVSPEGKAVARQVGPVSSEGLEEFIAGFDRQANRQ